MNPETETLINQWYVGNPIPAASSLTPSDPFAARAFLSSGALDKIKGMQHSEFVALRAVALMAVFLNAPANRPTAIAKLADLASSSSDPTAMYLHACAEMHACKDQDELLNRSALSLIDTYLASTTTRESAEELLALKAIHSVAVHDAESANSAATALARIDETAACRFAQAVVALSEGRAMDAWLGFEDLSNEFGSSASLAAGRIAASLARGLDISDEATAEARDEVGAANAATACFRAGKLDEADLWLKRLGQSHAFSIAARDIEIACSEFGRDSSQFC